MSETSRWRAHIPADIDRPDPLIGPFTGRQLLILAPVAAVVWLLFAALAPVAPVWVPAAVSAVAAGAAIALALGRRDGIGLDAFALAAWRWGWAPKRRVGAPEGIAPLPWWAPAPDREPRLEPLALPASAIGADGVIDLGERVAVLIACSTVNFHLASARDQEAAVGAFAAVLDALTEPVQVLVQSRALDLAPYTQGLVDNAPDLPHPALEEAACAHAAFLEHVRAERDLVHRTVVVAVTARVSGARARRMVLGRAQDVAAQLAGIGIGARVCDGAGAEALVRASLTPGLAAAAEGEGE